ncbi:MAG: mechanosensitive ion channel [Pseudomonadota bacterium]|nr:mechanosensitive ion channel [Pseudomonadota bacterium]
MKIAAPLFRLVFALLLLAVANNTTAESDDLQPKTDPLVPEKQLNDAIKAAEESTQLEKTTKESLIKLYKSTLEQQNKVLSRNEETTAIIHSREQAPAIIKSIMDELQEQNNKDAAALPGLPDDASVEEIEQLLFTKKSDLITQQNTLTKLDQQLKTLKQRPEAIRQQHATAAQKMEDVRNDMKFPVPEDQPPLLTEARRWELAARSAALNSEIEMLNQESLTHVASLELLKAQSTRTKNSLKRLNASINLLEKRLIEHRQSDIDQAIEKADAEIEASAGKHPLIREQAKKNAILSQELELTTQDLKRLTLEKDQTVMTAAKIDENFRRSREKLDIAGLSQVLGQVLLDRRRNLPDTKPYLKKEKIRNRLMAKAGLRQISNIEERQKLRDIDHYITELTAELPQQEAGTIHADLVKLAASRGDLLLKAIALDSAYLQTLEETDHAYRQTLKSVESYDQFLAKHLLWVRNAPLPALKNIPMAVKEFSWLLEPSLWFEAFRALLSSAKDSPVLGFGLLIFIILRLNCGRLRRIIEASGKPVGKPMEDHFSYTFMALLASLLIALPLPFAMALGGWQMGLSTEATAFSKTVSDSLLQTALIFFYLRSFYIICMPGGLAEVHFQWPKSSVQLLRKEFNRFMVMFLPTIFITITAFNYSSLSMEQGIGRASIMLTLALLGMFFYRLFGSKSAIQKLQHRFPDSLFVNKRLLWISLLLAIPVVLVTLAFLGYIYSAGILISNLLHTMWFSFALVVVQQLALRWLVLSHRRLAFKALLERHKNEAADDNKKPSSSELNEQAVADEKKEFDLSKLTQQSRKLLDVALIVAAITGLWLIWSEVLPALTIFDEITLWYYTDVIDGVEQHIAVTLGSIALTVILIVVTIVAARNIPALLEIVLRQSFGVRAGNRYAITTLVSHTIATIGIIIVFSNLGVKWSQLQWMVAALGVGIGFGLQEIIANFICGLIILFERPIRVGDFVTVGESGGNDSTGTVTRIRIRATTLLTRDRQELLVPNKEFITGRLLNWSLSDETVRIILPVGIAYGSDVKTAMALILQAAQGNANVLEEPQPSVTFESFGDSSLIVNLRCFLESVDYRLETTSQLHEVINEKLIAANIEIAFPQQDVHLDIKHPLEVRVQGFDGPVSNSEPPAK